MCSYGGNIGGSMMSKNCSCSKEICRPSVYPNKTPLISYRTIVQKSSSACCCQWRADGQLEHVQLQPFPWQYLPSWTIPAFYLDTTSRSGLKIARANLSRACEQLWDFNQLMSSLDLRAPLSPNQQLFSPRYGRNPSSHTLLLPISSSTKTFTVHSPPLRLTQDAAKDIHRGLFFRF